MKTVLRTAAAGVALASFAVSAPSWAATETATAEAEILAALDVTLDATRNTLDFGSLAESGAGGTVTLTPAGVFTCGAGLVCSGTTETPNFDIDGEAGATVNISHAPTMSLANGANTMNVALSASAASLVLDGSGVGTFDVGGVLTVGANQAVGTYTGSLTVTVVYN
jgi:hypothetical protein